VGSTGAGTGTARTSIASSVALALTAVLVVGGAFAWTQEGEAEPSGAPRRGTGAAAATTTTDPPRTVRRYDDQRYGQLRLSDKDICGLLDADEIQVALGLPGRPTVEEPEEDRWFGSCTWRYEGRSVFSVDVSDPYRDPDDQSRVMTIKEGMLQGYSAGFSIEHPDECTLVRAIVSNDACYRIAAVPRLGDEAWAISAIAERYEGRPFLIDAVDYRRGDVLVSARIEQGYLDEGGPEAALGLLRLFDSRMPATFTADPVTCPTPEDC
jgi:hypothetical protein